jgi:hypothetical protein
VFVVWPAAGVQLRGPSQRELCQQQRSIQHHRARDYLPSRQRLCRGARNEHSRVPRHRLSVTPSRTGSLPSRAREGRDDTDERRGHASRQRLPSLPDEDRPRPWPPHVRALLTSVRLKGAALGVAGPGWSGRHPAGKRRQERQLDHSIRSGIPPLSTSGCMAVTATTCKTDKSSPKAPSLWGDLERQFARRRGRSPVGMGELTPAREPLPPLRRSGLVSAALPSNARQSGLSSTA